MIRKCVKWHHEVTRILLSNQYLSEQKANVVFVVFCALREYQYVKGHNNATGLLILIYKAVDLQPTYLFIYMITVYTRGHKTYANNLDCCIYYDYDQVGELLV